MMTKFMKLIFSTVLLVTIGMATTAFANTGIGTVKTLQGDAFIVRGDSPRSSLRYSRNRCVMFFIYPLPPNLVRTGGSGRKPLLLRLGMDQTTGNNVGKQIEKQGSHAWIKPGRVTTANCHQSVRAFFSERNQSG